MVITVRIKGQSRILQGKGIINTRKKLRFLGVWLEKSCKQSYHPQIPAPKKETLFCPEK